jgi:hypothetical protein
MPIEWTMVLVAFVIVCLIEYGIWRREASGNDLRKKSPDLGSERSSQDPPTSSDLELHKTGLVKPPPSAPDTARQDETSAPINGTDRPQVTHPGDGEPAELGTEAWLNRAASETESKSTKSVIDESDSFNFASGPPTRPREDPADDFDSDTIVFGLDPSNDSDDNRCWSLSEQRRLLHCYSDNEDWDIKDLARHFATTSRSVVITLMYLLLEPQGPIEDPHCLKWRKPWTQKEVDDVHDLFRTGAALPSIAQASSRDQLSVAFRLFRDGLPEADGVLNDLFFDAF